MKKLRSLRRSKKKLRRNPSKDFGNNKGPGKR
jgi:hypothetical protein